MSAEYHGSNKWRASWADPPDVKAWLDRELMEGYTANICCGKSYIGDVRVDVDPENDPDVIADVHNLPFADCTFDTVYVDPPFSLYGYQDGYWPREAWRITRKRLILTCPLKRVNLPRAANKAWWVIEPKAGSPVMSPSTMQVFERPDGLEVFTDG
jgi:16S rRNA G966 N2-methylase RsmD